MVTYEHTLPLPIPAPSAFLVMLNMKKIQSLNTEMLARAQPSFRRSHPFARRHRHDAGDRRGRAPTGHFGARPPHRRQGRARESEGAEVDLAGSLLRFAKASDGQFTKRKIRRHV